MAKKYNSIYIIIVLALLVLAFVPLFYNLSFLPIRLFDESRLAVNALEMNSNNNFLVTHYKNEPDMWNLKPPLVIWCQTLMIKLLGISELAIRLPSALAGLFTVMIVFFYVRKVTSNSWFATLSSLILVATPGYITEHGTRSGDYDAMLVLFQMIYIFSWYAFLKNTSNLKILAVTFLAVLLAVFTKGIAGLLFLPALFIFTLGERKFWTVLKVKYFWLGFLCFLVLVSSYYVAREIYNPGYLHKVYENEIYFRYFDVNEGHEGAWNFYLDYLSTFAYNNWYVFAILGSAAIPFLKNKNEQKFLFYIFMNVLIFLLIISYSQTKIEWYAMPMYPLLAILTASFFWNSFNFISQKKLRNLSALKWIPLLLFTAFFVVNYSKVTHAVFNPDQTEKQNDLYKFSYLFQNAFRGKENLNGYYYCYPPYNAQFHFYTQAMSKQNQNVQLIEMEKLKSGMKVLAATSDVKNYITSHYTTRIEKEFPNDIVLFEIK